MKLKRGCAETLISATAPFFTIIIVGHTTSFEPK